MEPKQAILLNYGLLVADLKDDMQEKAGFISRTLHQHPELKEDPDLLMMGRLFGHMVAGIKDLDVEGARIWNRLYGGERAE